MSVPELWGVLALNLILRLIQPLVPAAWSLSLGWELHPYQIFATLVSLANFMLAGAMLMRLIGLGGDWFVRLPTYMAASVGVWTLPGLIVAFTAELDLGFLIFWGNALTILLAVAAILRHLISGPRPPIRLGGIERPSPSGAQSGLLLLGGVVLIAVAWLSLVSPVSLDDNLQLGYVQDNLVVSQINADEPALGAGIPPHTRGSLTTWPINLAAIVQPTGLPAQQAYWLLRTPLVLLDVLAVYALALVLLKKRGQAIFTAMVFCLVAVIYTGESDAIGFGLFGRTAQDKFVVRYLLYPITLAWCLHYLKQMDRRSYILIGVLVVGLSATHPIAMVLLGITLAGLGIVHLINGTKLEAHQPGTRESDRRLTRRALELLRLNWPMLRPYVFLAGLTATGVILPLIQQSSPDAPVVAYTLTDTVDPSLWFRVNLVLNNYRLFIGNYLGPRGYIVHPHVFMNAVILLPLLGLPLMWHRARRWMATELIVGVMILNPLLLLTPPVIQFIGDRATPWLLYRFAWPLTLLGTIALAWGLWSLYEWALPRVTSTRLRPLMPALTLLVVALLVSPRVYDGVQTLSELRRDPTASRCRTLQPLLSQIPSLVGTGTVVLSTPDMDMCLPASAAHAYPIEYFLTSTLARFPASRLPEAQQRLSDVYDFTVATVVDRPFMDSLTRWNVGLILVRQDHPIVSQLAHMPTYFDPVLVEGRYVVYRVKPGTGTDVMADVPGRDRWSQVSWLREDSLIDANTLWSQGRWDEAIVEYEKLAGAEADTRYLAQIGLGRSHQSAGRLPEARHAYEAATKIDGSDTHAWSLSGTARWLAGDAQGMRLDFDRAVEALPSNSTALQRLGEAHLALGQRAEARAAYERAAASDTEPGSSMYYRNLGLMYLSANLYDEAAAAFERSGELRSSVDIYANLSETYRRQGDREGAWRAARRAQLADLWSDRPYLSYAELYLEQENSAAALRSLRVASILKPRSVAVLRQANLVRKLEGPQAAIEHVHEMIGFKLGFSDALLAASRQEIAFGRVTDALGLARLAWKWEPLNADAAVLVGDIFRHIGHADEAEGFYRDAIQVDRFSHGAYVGMAALATSQGDWGTANGWAWTARTAAPYSSRPAIALGHILAAQGDMLEAAQAYQDAVELSPHDASPHVALAELYLTTARYSAAEMELERALRLDPNLTSAYRSLGSLHLRQGQVDQAQLELDEAVSRGPGEGANWLAKAVLLGQQGDREAALELLLRGTSVDPGYRPGQLAAATFYLEENDAASAERVFQTLIDQAPEFQEGYVGMGELRERQGRSADAVALYQLAVDRVADSMAGDARAHMADLMLRQGSPSEARSLLMVAIRDQPLFIDGYIRLSESYRHAGDLTAASDIMQRARDLFPASTSVYIELANLALAQGRVDQARALYEDASDRLPGSQDLAIARSQMHLDLGEPDQALAALDPILHRTPGDGRILAHQVAVLLRSGRPSDAVVTAQEYTAVAAGSASSWLALARAYEAAGIFDAADIALGRAVEVEPGNASAWLERAAHLAGRGEAQAALQALANAREIDRSDPAPYLVQAQILSRQGQDQEALAALDRASQLDRTQIESLVAQGRIHERRGEDTLALSSYALAVERAPTQAAPYLAAAEVHLSRGDWEVAGTWIDQGTAAVPGSCRAHQNRGRFLLDFGRIDEGQTELITAADLPGCGSSPWLDLGHLASLQGQSAEAQVRYRRAIAAFPDDPLAYTALAGELTLQGDWAGAFDVFARAEMALPASALVQIEIARANAGRGDLDAALFAAGRAVEVEPANPAAWVSEGDMLVITGDYTAAQNRYQSAAHQDPTSALPWVSLGSLYDLLADPQAAVGAYQTALALEASSPRPYLAFGDHYRRWGDYDHAAQMYQRAAEVDRRNVDGLIRLSELHAQEGRFDAALSVLSRALPVADANAFPSVDIDAAEMSSEIPDGRADVYLALGSLFRLQSDWASAAAAYQQSIHEAPGVPTGYLELAATYRLQGLTEESLAEIQRALATAPGYSPAHVALGDWYRTRGVSEAADGGAAPFDPQHPGTAVDWASAESAYLAAVELNPSDVEGRLKLAELYFNLGRREQALEQIEALLAARPTSGLGRTALARQLLNAGQVERARTELEGAIAGQPTDPNARIALGDVYQQVGFWMRAQQEYETATRVAPRSPDGFVALGDWFLLRGERAAAVEYYRQAIQVAPDRLEAYLRLSQLYQDEGEIGESLAAIREALTRSPASSQANVRLGDWYTVNLYAIQRAQAGETLRAEISSAPRSLLETLYYGLSDLERGDVTSAYENFETAIEEHPDSLLPYVAMGRTYYLLPGWRGAEEAYLMAIRQGMVSPDALIALGSLYEALDRYEDARRLYQAAVDTFPGMAQGYVALGSWLRLHGTHEEAEAMFKQATEVAPGELAGYLALADLYLVQGQRGRAYAVLAGAATIGMAPEAVACGPGSLPTQPGTTASSGSLTSLRQAEAWQCQWNFRPWDGD